MKTTFKIIFLILFFNAVFLYFTGPIEDVDFLFHLKTGEYITEHHEIPTDDPFTYYDEGISNEREKFLLSQYWLTQVLYYSLFSWFGFPAIVTLRAALFTFFLVLLWHALRERGDLSAFIITAFVCIALVPYKGDRPQIFSFAFALLLIVCIESYREKRREPRILIAVPFLMLLWANMHGGYVFGLVTLVIYAMSETFMTLILGGDAHKHLASPLNRKELFYLLGACFSGIAVSYVNPSGGQFASTLLSLTRDKSLILGVREYSSLGQEVRMFEKGFLPSSFFLILLGFVIVVQILQIMRTKRIDVTSVALIAFSAFASFTAVRYIPFFFALGLPLTSRYRFLEDDSTNRLSHISLLGWVGMMILVVMGMFSGVKDFQGKFRLGENRYFPEKAADFLVKNNIRGRIFNPINYGNYLIWRLYPNNKIFQDTRQLNFNASRESAAVDFAMLYEGQSVLEALVDAVNPLVPSDVGKVALKRGSFLGERTNIPLWKVLLEKSGAKIIVYSATRLYGDLSPFVLRLIKDDDWVLVYADGVALVFLKRDSQYGELIEHNRKPKEFVYDEILLESLPLVNQKALQPGPYASMGFAYLMRGELEKSKTMIEAALALDDRDMLANATRAYLALYEKKSTSQKSSVQ